MFIFGLLKNMANKIVITGGAGFIGSYLLRNIKNKKNLIVVDKLKSKKVYKKFRSLNIKYVQGNLLNQNFAKKVYKNASTVYHLAGIVKVPNTDKNLDLNKERKIFNEAIHIMKNLLQFCSINAKIIFPSTHLVFENCKKDKITFNEKSITLAN